MVPLTGSHSPRHQSDGEQSNRRFAFRIGLRRLSQMCHHVGTGLRAGVDIVRIWETEASSGGARHRSLMSQVRDRVAGGESVEAALSAAEGYLPPLVREMVEVGERTGRLDQIFLHLGEHYDNLLRMRRAFLAGIAWPLLQLSLALAIIGAFILVMGMIWRGTGDPPITFFGLYGPRGFAIYVSVLAAVGAAIAVAILGVSNGWFRLDWLLRGALKIPGLGRGLETIAISRLTWSFALVTDSDISAQRSIELAVRTTRNSYYTSHLEEMKQVIGRGGDMHDAFRQAGVFPNDFLAALQVGETSGRISESMLVLARDYEERAKLFYKALAVAAGIGVFILVATLIIVMIFSLFLKYLSILENASQI